ncbi:aminoglycoside phosphotransferase family protein [Marivita hallyeonensis]|nr:phosphotransferase [Marivita hallyeonensis]
MTNVGAFLSEHGWSTARQQPLAGDASSRRYIRVFSGEKRAILMVDPQDDTGRFSALSQHLSKIGLSAPQVYARAPGLMLLEDFGDDQFAQTIARDPTRESPLYRAATDVLVHLEGKPIPSGLHTLTPNGLADMLEPAFTHYLPAIGQTETSRRNEIIHRFTDLFHMHLPTENVLVLRDYHAENMIWLPDRDDVQRVGLLDFQDAVIGPPVYDLVSLLQDARRDVSPACQSETLNHFAEATGRSMDVILPLFHLLGVQRNLRILGVFARLAADRGKPGYIDLIPRVWGHTKTSLAAPVMEPLAPLIQDCFPEPTAERLRRMKTHA